MILVPNWSGGIDRLFENINQFEESDFSISPLSARMGAALRGTFIRCRFGLVYYTSAFLYTLILPIRLLGVFPPVCIWSRRRVPCESLDWCKHYSQGTFRACLSIISRSLRRSPAWWRLPSLLRTLASPAEVTGTSLYLNAERVIVLGSMWKQYVEEEIGVAPGQGRSATQRCRGTNRFYTVVPGRARLGSFSSAAS